MLCRISVAAANFWSRPGFPLCHSHTSCGDAFKLPLPPVEERHAGQGATLELVLLTGQWRNGGKGVGVSEPRIDGKDFEEKACKLKGGFV